MLCKCSGKYIDIYFILKITCLCLYFPSVSPFCSQDFLSFRFAFVGLASDVSPSSFCVILIFCVALLNDSLSFSFFPVLQTFIVLLLVFRGSCLFLPLRWLPVGLPRCCSLFSYTVHFLSPRLLGFLLLGLFLFCSGIDSSFLCGFAWPSTVSAALFSSPSLASCFVRYIL